MAKEVRVVVFDQDEVLTAAQEFVARRMRCRDSAPLDRVTLSRGLSGIFCELHSTKFSLDDERVLQPDDLLMAMLLFCSRNRIPLSIRATKRLELAGERLTMEMTMPSRQRASATGVQGKKPARPGKLG